MSEKTEVQSREFEVIYPEYDCGRPCTPNGCPGHEGTQPVGFYLDGVSFYVDGYQAGDFPSHDMEINNEVSEVIQTLVDTFGEQP
jgi:hypothetical protein